MVKRRLLAAGALALVAGAGLPAPAQAATYRYWSYWVGDSGDWAFSNIGPASRIPADGAVEGWRFAEAGLAGGPAPAVAPTFDDVCGDTEPPAEGKRVAVIVDPGSADEAPDGESPPGAWAMCVTAGADATGYAVLRAAAEVRLDRGLVCGIGGYPAAECAVVVREAEDDATPAPTPRPTETPTDRPSDNPTEEKSRTPKPTQADTSGSESASTPSVSASPSASVARESASTSSASPATSWPSALPTPSASPTVSLLATPVAPAQGGGGSAIIAGLALVAVAALGAAALLRGRRRRS